MHHFLSRLALAVAHLATRLAGPCRMNYRLTVSAKEIAEAVMALPEAERLQLARRIVAAIAAEREITKKISDAVQGIEDIVTGKLNGLTETEFRNALK